MNEELLVTEEESQEQNSKIKNYFKNLPKTNKIGIIAALILIGGGILWFSLASIISNKDQPLPPPKPTPTLTPSAISPVKSTPNVNPTSTFVPDQLIIKYKSGQTPEELTSQRKEEIQKIFNEAGVLSQEKLYPENAALKGYFMLKFKKGINLENAKDILNTIPEIENAEQNNIIDPNN